MTAPELIDTWLACALMWWSGLTLWLALLFSCFCDTGLLQDPLARIQFGLGHFATAFARWDPSLLPRGALSLLELGLPAFPDYVPPALTFTPRTRSYSIEGMRVDVGGLRIPFRARGGIVYGFAHPVNPMYGMRIGEASNAGPGGVGKGVGGVYYGRFANENQAGIFIKRIGTIRTDYEYVLAIPARPSQPRACEAHAREDPFICDVRFVKLRSIHGLRREPSGWTCRTWVPAGQPLAGPHHLPLLEDLQLAHTATSNGADPVRYRLVPAAPAAAAPPIDAGDDPMPPAAQDPADDIPAALRIAEAHELA